MPRLGFAHLGSGCVPYINLSPSVQPTPHSNQGDVLFGRDGEQVIIINPEDFSVFRNGITKQVTLTANVAQKLDVSLENRRAIAIVNLDATAVLYMGFHSEVTVNNGWPIFAQMPLSINCSNKLNIYGVCASNITVGVMEVS